MKKYSRFLLTTGFVSLLSCSFALASSDITPEMKANGEKAIQTCEQTYQNVKNLRDQFDKVKKPTLLSSAKTKELYKNLDVNKLAYDMRMAEFAQFTNDKIKIRTAKTFDKFRDEVAAYSSNCTRFATGIKGFVDWATTGKGPAGFDTIYKGWQDEARAKMK